MKKLLVMAVILLMMLALVGCGGGDAPAEPAPPADEPQQQEQQEAAPEEQGADEQSAPEQGLIPEGFEGTKTGSFYGQFNASKMYMKYEMSFEGEEGVSTAVTATNGDKTYMESDMGGVLNTVIMDGEYMYTIDHASKTVIKMDMQVDMQEEMVDTLIEESDVSMTDFKTGQREIDGKTYDTEEWMVEGVQSIMCFDGKDLVYMITDDGTNEYIIKILEFSDKVDDSLFEIPADYQLMEF